MNGDVTLCVRIWGRLAVWDFLAGFPDILPYVLLTFIGPVTCSVSLSGSSEGRVQELSSASQCSWVQLSAAQSGCLCTSVERR